VVAGPLKIVWRGVVGNQKRLAVDHFDLTTTVTAGPRKDAVSQLRPPATTCDHLRPAGNPRGFRSPWGSGDLLT
jgi:hypothetical protein